MSKSSLAALYSSFLAMADWRGLYDPALSLLDNLRMEMEVDRVVVVVMEVSVLGIEVETIAQLLFHHQLKE